MTALANLPALGNGFVNWDDTQYVTENAFVRSLDSRLLRAAFLEFHAANWHPITWISHAVDVALWDMNPFGHHLTNLLLHVLMAMLLVCVTLTLVDARPGHSALPSARRATVAATASGLLFAVHPVHVESVSWISQRKDLLCGVFVALAVLAFLRHARARSSGDAIHGDTPWSGWLLASLGAGLAALLSKPMAASLPVMLLIIDYGSGRWRGPFPRNIPLIAEKLPFVGLALGTGILTYLAQAHGGAVTATADYPLVERLLHLPVAYARYLQLLVWPHALNAFRPLATAGVTAASAGLALLLLVAITWGVVAVRHRSRAPLATWLFFLVTLAPVIGIVQVGAQSTADRYLYVPGVAPLWLAGWLVAEAWEGGRARRFLVVGIFPIAIVALGMLSWAQHRVWHDGITLWTRVVELDPNSPTPHAQLGEALLLAGRIQDARHALTEGLQRFPSDPRLNNKLAILELDAGSIQTAERLARLAVAAAGKDPRSKSGALNTLGEIRFSQGDFAGARELFRQAVALDGTVPANRFNLALSLERAGDLAAACEEWRRFLRIEPAPAERARVERHLRQVGCPGA